MIRFATTGARFGCTGMIMRRMGAYFVTICAKNREHVFGDVVDGVVRENGPGQMVIKWWNKTANNFPNVDIDEYIVMPNHFHGIIWFVGADPCVCPGSDIISKKQGALHQVVQWFKTMTTNEYLRRVKTGDWRPFPGKLWQRNYYERIVRNDAELNQIRRYIQDNPQNWDQDPENLAKTPLN